MYQLSINGNILGYADAPEYCYKLPSGSAQVIGEKEAAQIATGIIYQGTIYNILDYHEFPDTETVYVSEIDGSALITAQQQKIAELDSASLDSDELNIDHELRITMLELGLEE